MSDQPTTLRSATATATVSLGDDGVEVLRAPIEGIGSGLTAARVAGRIAVKHAHMWLAHHVGTPTEVDLRFTLNDDDVVIKADVSAVATSSISADALTAVTGAAICIVDLVQPHVAHELSIDKVSVTNEKGGLNQFASKIDNARALVIVLSDSVARGTKPDTAGRAVADGLQTAGFEIASYEVLPDKPIQLKQTLTEWLTEDLELIVTVGGTGVGRRDMTVETVRPFLDVEMPGVMEAARSYGQARTPYSMLSRGIAGIVGKTVLVTFPGSRRGAEETLEAILPGLIHLVEVCRKARPHKGGYN